MKTLEEVRAAIRQAAGPSAVLNDTQCDNILTTMFMIISKDLMTLRDIKERLGLPTLSAANMRAHRGQLPPSVATVGGSRVWFGPHVEAYIAENPKVVHHNAPKKGAA